MKQKIMAAILLSTLSVPAMSAPNNFMRGSYLSLLAGYQTNKFAGISYSNSPLIGLAYGYNFPIPGNIIAGYSLEGIMALSKLQNKSGRNAQVSAKRTFTGSATAHAGIVMGNVALEATLAAVVAAIKGKVTYKGRTQKEKPLTFGVAPGVGISMAIAQNVSAGINYRYEIFPKLAKASQNGHSIMAKATYHF